MTAKAEGLWIPRGAVSQEDIRHMQSRVLMFSATATVPNLRDTVPCVRCLCFWIRKLAAQHDTRLVLQAPPSPSHYAIEVPDMRRSESITGLAALAERAKLPAHKIDQIRAELEALGAIHIADCSRLAVFELLANSFAVRAAPASGQPQLNVGSVLLTRLLKA